MKTVYFFTKTRWDEPPRIRHQLAFLLRDSGYKVIFFEKPCLRNLFSGSCRQKDGITLVRVGELLHHQLRPVKWLSWLSSLVSSIQIRHAVNKYMLDEPSVIINFNYDYYFIKNAYKSSRVILLLNDDFLAAAKAWMKSEAERVEGINVHASDCVLTVSKKIYNRYSELDGSIQLFLPWSETGYIEPLQGTDRDTILYFGYINFRLDWDVLYKIMEHKEYKIRMVGDVMDKPSEIHIKALSEYDGFEYLPSARIDDIFLDDVFCSISPYDPSIETVQCITLNNRSLRVLSYGLPLVICDMPYLLIEEDVIIPYSSHNGLNEILQKCRRDYYKNQDKIKLFVENNTYIQRKKQIMDVVEV